MRNFIITFIFCITSIASSGKVVALSGSTYQERAESLINQMLNADLAQDGDIKYVSPFYFARLLGNERREDAVKNLLDMYNRAMQRPDEFYASGSNQDFCAHATIHGYLLTKEFMPDTLRKTIRSFMAMGKYIRKNVTLNMKMMQECSGYLCAQEWSDFIDADGNDALKLKKILKEYILNTILPFVTKNCPEADAFTYIGTNLQYLRMLAEFCDDEELRHSAENAYHHIIAQMLLPWNKGLYCANPPRSKGWANLQTGNLDCNVQIGQLAWLFYGAQDERLVETSVGNRDNFGCFNFWMAYQRNITPVPFLDSLNRQKRYPYSFEAMRMESKYRYSRYTYQSDNYGLSTQHIEAEPKYLKGFQYTYAFKETRNLHLVWQSEASPVSVFSVCHDNPERPQPHQSRSNKLGYGENPYHRVFGRGKSAIGAYVVPMNYMDTPLFYRMYVPFTRKGILKRIVKRIGDYKWIICHTGSMMFAFTTPEEWAWEKPDGKYAIPGHDVLVLSDADCRRGSWILETTEVTADYRDENRNLSKELDNFAESLKTKVRVELSEDYAVSDNPVITYRNIDGDILQLQYFSPETPYEDYYRMNGKNILPDFTHISKSPYMEQEAGSHAVTFYLADGERVLNLE